MANTAAFMTPMQGKLSPAPTPDARKPTDASVCFLNGDNQDVYSTRPLSKKRKRVTWAADDRLNQVRFFYKTEAPAKARYPHSQDLESASTFGQYEPSSTFAAGGIQESGSLPPGFAPGSSERLAKRQKTDVEGVEAMHIQLAWNMPAEAALDSEWSVVAGEESAQKEQEPQREKSTFEAVYPRINSIPDSPAEPLEAPVDVEDSNVPEIPLHPVEDEEEDEQEAVERESVQSKIAAPSGQGASAAVIQAHDQTTQYPPAVDVDGLQKCSLAAEASPEIAAAAAAAVASMSQGGEVDKQLLSKMIAVLTAQQEREEQLATTLKASVPQQQWSSPSASSQALENGGPPAAAAFHLGPTASVPKLQNKEQGFHSLNLATTTTQLSTGEAATSSATMAAQVFQGTVSGGPSRANGFPDAMSSVQPPYVGLAPAGAQPQRPRAPVSEHGTQTAAHPIGAHVNGPQSLHPGAPMSLHPVSRGHPFPRGGQIPPFPEKCVTHFSRPQVPPDFLAHNRPRQAVRPPFLRGPEQPSPRPQFGLRPFPGARPPAVRPPESGFFQPGPRAPNVPVRPPDAVARPLHGGAPRPGVPGLGPVPGPGPWHASGRPALPGPQMLGPPQGVPGPRPGPRPALQWVTKVETIPSPAAGL